MRHDVQIYGQTSSLALLVNHKAVWKDWTKMQANQTEPHVPD